ncbi:MAG: bifunctional diguanylate cyclase/phosphodiesterase [Actinomycetota bacterium]
MTGTADTGHSGVIAPPIAHESALPPPPPDSTPSRSPSTLRLLHLAALGYLAVGVVCGAAFLVGDQDIRDATTTVTIALMIPAALIAWRVHRFDAAFIWAVGAVAILYGAAIVIADSWSSPLAPIVESSLDLVANGIIIGLIVAVVRRRRGEFSRGDLLDGGIIAVAAWMFSWVLFVEPYVDGGTNSTVRLLVDSLYLPMNMPMVALCCLLLFTSTRPGPSMWMLVVGILANVVGDVFWALDQTRGVGAWAVTVAGLLYVAAYAFNGAALVHPSATEMIGRSGAIRRSEIRGRIVTTAAALLGSVMVVGLLAPVSTADKIVRFVSLLALLVLVGARLVIATHAASSAQARLREMAMTDPLTALPNKIALIDEADHELDRAWKTDRYPSVYLFDIDRFKNTNDSLGHSAGDEVLRVIADRLVFTARSMGATVARPSGDEFVVFDPTPTGSAQALAHAEVFHSVFAQPISTGSGTLFVAASAGVASVPDGAPVNGEKLYRWADIAMYRAKSAGRNCLALYDESMQERVSKRLRIETELHGALDRREFRVFHQPIVDLEQGRVSGFEALIRWQRSDGTLVSPAEFIAVAEETGMISSIGSWVMLEAMSQLKRLTDDRVVDEEATMSVNVSPIQLADPGFTDTVEEAITRSQLEPHRLWIEVTESMMIDSPDVARTTLRRLRRLGVRIALDDFGTGYSSLSLLSQFPLQRIKIDRVFIDGIADSPNDRALVRTIVGMGQSLGLDIVAEGVETVEQLRLLREIGCAKAQGFLISHPVPADAVRSTVDALQGLIEQPGFAQILGSPRP